MIEGAVQIIEHTQAERFVRDIADHLPAMIAYWDDDLRCRFANAPYREWFGWSPEQMIGVRIDEVLGDQLFSQNEQFIRAVLLGEPQSFERKLTKSSGEQGHVLSQYIPDIDARGAVVGFYVLLSDITPLKRAQHELEQVNKSLVEACAEAESSTALKSEFLSNMSHELRTPLTSIIGFSDILARKIDLQDEHRRYVDRIHDASMSLLATVNDILEFSKLEAGQVEIEARAIDPCALGQTVLDLFEPQAEQKGLSRAYETEDLPPRVWADDTRLRQILLNFIGNALKFTSAGGVTLRASYDQDLKRLRYAVMDTGPGIPWERRSRLFQRFSQIDASTTRSFGGTGLGLAICRGLAEAMGGEVGVQSVPGRGSCFWLEVPCEPAEAEPRSDADSRAADDADLIEGLRLLIVDDNSANRELTRVIAQSFGVHVFEAASGAEAVSTAQSKRFDVILMDIRMPGVDGLTAAKIIRSQQGPNNSTPIVAFTADVVSETPTAWAGIFDRQLAKPIVAAELLAILTLCAPVGDAPAMSRRRIRG